MTTDPWTRPDEPRFPHENLEHVIAVGNGKGGVGKTTLTTNIAALVAAGGAKVLIIDVNAQGNCGEDLGYTGQPEIDDDGKGLVDAIRYGTPLVPVRAVGGRPGLDVVPGGAEVRQLPTYMYERFADSGEFATLALARSLLPIASQYDLILIDSPPENRPLQQLVLGAAHWLIIPIKSDDSSRKGMQQIAYEFARMRRVNPNLELLGVALFAAGTSARRIREEVRRDVASDLGGRDLMFEAVIRHAEAPARDARRRGQPFHELEVAAANGPTGLDVLRGLADRSQLIAGSSGAVAADLATLTREVLTRRAALLEETESVVTA
ncbi:Cellulose biosynthesis protein BcsQ [Parafrankia irregularis]|uniref:Cellulose biosynthesis protein BcsQ n=1 Tax=Parafrankia irregularis TaxID=795642 RepID=A0A0S4QYX6_9ACTN|nr:Cellulose biosynthesis protein BcsQ [Parafrankia irregularis]